MSRRATGWLPGRWGRAARFLPVGSGRLLDVGCAYGFLTARLASERFAVGLEPLWEYLARARREHPRLLLVQGAAERLPVRDGAFDAVLMLDVLEHVADERRALDEVARVLRPGGRLVLSAPQRGVLAALDSQNLYDSLRRRVPSLPPREHEIGAHRHYSVAEVRRLLAPSFDLTTIRGSGLGWPELINLALLVVAFGLARNARVFARLQHVYFVAYFLDDVLPLGRAGYHLMVAAVRK